MSSLSTKDPLPPHHLQPPPALHKPPLHAPPPPFILSVAKDLIPFPQPHPHRRLPRPPSPLALSKVEGVNPREPDRSAPWLDGAASSPQTANSFRINTYKPTPQLLILNHLQPR